MLRRNVLIFQTGGLGDFVLTWPFAVAVARIYPQSRIMYVTHPQKGELARRVLRLEATDIEAGWHGLYAADGKLPAATTKILESAHALYTFLPVNGYWQQNVQRINSLMKCVEIDARIGPEYTGHHTDRILESLQDHQPERSAMQQILRSVADRGIGYKPAGGAHVAIHPGSGSPKKCWPLDRYIDLADRLQKAGREVKFLTGEVERDRWTAADFQQLKSVAALRQCNSYVDLLNELSTADAFIGNDSGPAHLAGVIGIPTITLFGPTEPAQWKPLGPQVKILHKQVLDAIKVEDVIYAVPGRQRQASTQPQSVHDEED